VFIILFSLGTWQIYRLKWKNTLIASKEKSFTSPPLSMEAVLEKLKSNQEIEFQSVEVKGNWVENTLYYIIGRTYKGKAGYHLVAPLKLENGKIIFINLGWSDKKEFLDLKGAIVLEGYIRYPYKNIFTPDPIPKKKEWGAVLPEQLKVELSDAETIVKDVYVQLKDPLELPQLDALEKIILTIDIPNRHLGYIITWYGLAIAWLFIMIKRGKKFKGR
jgi:surfeit locus 1 family protein